MQQQEKMVLGVSLVVTLMAGWVQVGEAKAERVPVCESELIIVAFGSCATDEGVGVCNRFTPSGCTTTATTCTDNSGESGGFSVFCTRS